MHLNLSGVGVADGGLHSSSLALPPSLRSLELDDTDGIPFIEFISAQPNLTHVSLAYTHIVPWEFEDYSVSDAAKSLTSLNIRGMCL